jgi:hypothetical protein
MTNTQRLEREIPTLDPICELAFATLALVRHTQRAAAELWLEIRQWG